MNKEDLPDSAKGLLDSSVIIAVLKNERIDESAYALIDGGIMNAVNVAEVYTKLSDYRFIATPRVDALLATLGRIELFNVQQARICGLLRDATRHLGLSLGDRAYIATAIYLGVTVYTTESKWTQIELGCRVELLR